MANHVPFMHKKWNKYTEPTQSTTSYFSSSLQKLRTRHMTLSIIVKTKSQVCVCVCECDFSYWNSQQQNSDWTLWTITLNHIIFYSILSKTNEWQPIAMNVMKWTRTCDNRWHMDVVGVFCDFFFFQSAVFCHTFLSLFFVLNGTYRTQVAPCAINNRTNVSRTRHCKQNAPKKKQSEKINNRWISSVSSMCRWTNRTANENV